MSRRGSTSSPPAPRRRWRLLRFAFLMIVGIALLLGAGYWLVTSSWFIVARVTPLLEGRLGGEVAIGSATYVGDGRFIFRDAAIRVPGLAGTSGEVARIGRAEILVDPARLWSGDIELFAVTLTDVLLRFSEDAGDTGQFSFMHLTPDWPDSGDDDPLRPPSVVVENVTLEYGSHEGGTYTRLGQRLVAGSMQPIEDDDHGYSFRLNEISDAGVPIADGLAIAGRWDAATFDHRARIDGLVLDDATYNMCPQLLRLWWERMQLEGRVSDALIEWDRERSLIVEFTVENVELTLPFTTNDLLWARYQGGEIIDERRRPRMRVQSGRIRLENDRLVLDQLVGKLGVDEDARVAAVPYSISLTIDQIPPPVWADRDAWMERVLATVPFEMSFFMPEFRVDTSAEQSAVLDLPQQIARILQRFTLTEWTISTNLRMNRSEPTVNADGVMTPQTVRTSGTVVIRDAAGRFEKFPYRVDDVDAVLSIVDDRVIIDDLIGYASNRTPLRLSGEVRSPGPEARVDLRLTATGVPIDDRLREAFRGSALELFDALQDKASAASLAAADLLPDEASLEALRAERTDLAQQLAAVREQISADSTRIDEIEQRLERVEARLAGGTFALGGSVDVDLDITRTPGRGVRTEVSGRLGLRNLGVLYDRFPYPFLIKQGAIDWAPDKAVIVTDEQSRGLEIVTPGGGRGLIRGHIDRPRIDGRRSTRPDLEISIDEDQVNPLMLAAIPMTSAERERAEDPKQWPGLTRARGARLLDGIGLAGSVSYTGRLAPRDDGKTGFSFDVVMRDGAAAPSDALSELVGASGLLWPDEFTVRDISGRLRISREGLELQSLEGSHQTGTVTATGRLDLQQRPAATSVDVRFSDLHLGEYLLDLVPGETAENARELWARYQPDGTFDATLQYRESGGRAEPPRVTVDRARFGVEIAGSPLAVRLIDGKLELTNNDVSFDELAIAFAREQDGVEFEDGTLQLTGSYGMADGDGELEMRGEWEGGRFESPLVLEAMLFIEADDLLAQYRELEPAGRFDARFSYRSDAAAAPARGASAFNLELLPSTMSFRLGDQRLTASIESGGLIELSSDGARLRELTGRIEDGTFQLDGVVRFDPLREIDLNMAYEGPIADEKMQALLPPGARGVLERIEFRDGEHTALRDARLRLARLAPAAPWSVQFDGRVEVEGASLTVGARAEDVAGAAMLHVRREVDRPLEVTMDAALEQMRFYGRRVTNVRIPAITYDERTRAIGMPELRGDCYGGVVWASVAVVGDDRRQYDFDVELVGLSLAELYADIANLARDADDGTGERADRRQNRGRLYGGFRVGGEIGKPETRRGRGALRAIGGSLENIPLVLQVVNLIQFTLPTRGDLDHADVTCYIDGDWMMFERILLESTLGEIATLQLFGEGRMNINTLELDTRFRSRSSILLVREIAGQVSDQLYLIEVTGPLGNPRARLIPLPGLGSSATSRAVAAPERDGGS